MPGSAEVARFADWLGKDVVPDGPLRTRLGWRLGAGAMSRINRDLAGSYLPEWSYVVSDYLGPVQEIQGRPLAPETINDGQHLYAAAARVAVPCRPLPDQEQSFSSVAAPVMAAFSLPAIVGLATSGTPGQPWRDISLTLLVTGTGLLLASFQLTIGSLYVRFYDRRYLRAGLSFTGIGFLAAALIVLVAAVAGHWWVSAGLAVLGTGAVGPVLLRRFSRQDRGSALGAEAETETSLAGS